MGKEYQNYVLKYFFSKLLTPGALLHSKETKEGEKVIFEREMLNHFRGRGHSPICDLSAWTKGAEVVEL